MSLPPLPEHNVEFVSGHREPLVFYDADQMREYGQLCRDQAIAEYTPVGYLEKHHLDGSMDIRLCNLLQSNRWNNLVQIFVKVETE